MDDKLTDLLDDAQFEAAEEGKPSRGRRRARRRAARSAVVAPADADDDFVEDLLAAPRGRPSLVTLGLCLLLIVAVSFGAGVLMQKHHDRGLSSASGLPSGLAGLGSGNLPDFSAQGGGTGSNSGTGSGSDSTAPAVVGTIVSIKGSDITVRDLGGKTHVVHTTGTTSVTASAKLADLKPGTTVSVAGTTGSNGTVTATSVTAR